MEKHVYHSYYEQVRPALVSKVEELRYYGYNDVTVASLWQYLTEKVWKKEQERTVSRLVGDILSVKPGAYMSWNQVTALKQERNSDLLSPEELEALFKPLE